MKKSKAAKSIRSFLARLSRVIRGPEKKSIEEEASPREIKKHAWDRVYTKEELDNIDWDLIDEDAVIFGQAMVHKAYTDNVKKKKSKNQASDK